MIKKILISIGVLFSFFLMFLFGLDKINVLAYSDIGNALGSYPVKMDYENYNTGNLFNLENTTGYQFNVNVEIRDNQSVIFYTNPDTGVSRISYYIDVEPYQNYTLSFESVQFSQNDYPYLMIGYNNNPDSGNYFIVTNSSNYVNTFNVGEHNRIYIKAYVSYSLGGETLTLNKFMFNKGDTALPYGVYFKFGYNVNYSLAVNNLTSSQVNAGIAITDANGNYLKTGNCIIPANSSTICSNLNDPLYLPFNIDNNGYISFNYSLGLFIGPVGSLSVTPNDSGFNFVPVFNAYYNGEYTNNLYFKDRYTFNNLFLSGFNVSVNSSTLSKVTFGRTQVDSEFSMNSNNIVNFATDKKIETGIYNYINYVDFINSSPSDIYSFVITTGVSSPVLFEDRIYTISFSNLSLKVNGDTGNVSPLPNNPNTINKYNECSAWYDIPCQLGNAVTYVIYEAPIISPVLTFIVSFITIFSSLVSFVDLFRSFGIVFGCFIIYMFIELLHKYSK